VLANEQFDRSSANEINLTTGLAVLIRLPLTLSFSWNRQGED
jgi:hypothetical protein